MSLLGDLKGESLKPHYARTLIQGQPGTGKTTLGGSMAELGPMLYVYVQGEEGVNSLAGMEHVDNLTVVRLTSIPMLEQLNVALLKEKHDYVTVFIDGLSALQTMWKKHLLGLPMDAPAKDRPKTDFAFWGELRDGFSDFFTFFYALADPNRERPMHVVMSCQTAIKDDAEGNERMQPDLHTGPLSSAVKVPDQVVYTHMARDPEDFNAGPKHVVRIKPSDRVMAKTRCSADISASLPDVIGLKTRATLPNYLRLVGVAGLD